MCSFTKFNVTYFLVLYIFFTDINTTSCTEERKLKHELNPGCNSTCGQLLVITAEGPEDILYHLWDFSHKPTFLMAEVPLQTTLIIDWDNFTKYQEKSISFTTTPSYIFGVVMNKVYEFNDRDDSGNIHYESNETFAMDAANFNWTVEELLDDVSSNTVTYSIIADGYQSGNISKDGRLNIKNTAFGNVGHAENLPHLLHTENSSQIELIIDSFTTSFPNSRFAIELITFSSNGNDSKAKLSAKKTIDDENTPGVFVLDTLIMEDDQSEINAQSGFLQWRPVVYTSADKIVANSTKTWEYDVANLSDRTALTSSLIYPFRGSDLSGLFIKAENISFGSKNDGYYAKTNFSSWSFVVGVGRPPEQPFSMLVFLVIAIGLGFPTLIIIGGTAFMIYKRIRSGN